MPRFPGTNSMITENSAGHSARYSQLVRLVGLGLSIFIAIYLLTQIDLSHLEEMLGGLPIANLVVAFAIYMLLNFVRALRFRLLLGDSTLPLRGLYPIALYHNFLVRTLPFKSGELSYLAMVRHHLRQPFGRSVGSLVGARLLDLFVVVSVGVVGLITATGPFVDQAQPAIPIIVLCLILGAVGFYFAGPLLRRASAWGTKIAANGSPRTAKGMAWAEQRFKTIADQFDEIRQPRTFLAALLLSVGTYVASASFSLVLVESLGITQPPGAMLLIISIAMLAEALPLSVAGFGTVEGGWTVGLTAIAGLAIPEAVSIAFFLHACQLIAASLSGLLGYCSLPTRVYPARGAYKTGGQK